MTIKVLIADDHGVVRQGLKTFLSLDPEIEIVGMAVNGYEVLEMTRQVHPEVILLDLMMPKMNGFEVIKALRAEFPNLRILVLTSAEDEISLSQALRFGANGYLLKNIDADELVQTVKAASTHQLVISPQLVHQLITSATKTSLPSPLDEFGLLSDNKSSAPAAKVVVEPISNLNQTSALGERLSRREAEILSLIADGKANKQIAHQLGLSEGTVKTHVSIILGKFGLQSRTQAALYASKMGLLAAENSDNSEN